jgi:hypothetical protein
MSKRPDIVDSRKASSHPLRPGRVYTANVTAVDTSGKVHVSLPSIGSTYGPIVPLGTTALNKYSVGDVVKCMFTDEYFNEIIVFGSSRVKEDVFASKAVVQTMQSTIATMQAQITSLQNQLNSHSH